MKIFLDVIQFLHNLMQQFLRIENTYRLYFLDLIMIFSFLSNLEKQYINHRV